jgi:hypothetical protein
MARRRNPDWCSVKEAALRLTTSHVGVKRLIQEGRLGSFQNPVSGKLSVSRADVDRLVEASTRPARVSS